MAEDSAPKKKTVSTRLPADDYDRLEAYCDDHGISQADALRRFILRGLDAEATEPWTVSPPGESEARFSLPHLLFGLVYAVLGALATFGFLALTP